MGEQKENNAELYIGAIDIKKLFKLTKSGAISVDKTNKEGQPFKNGAVYLPISIWVNEVDDEFGNRVAVKVGRGEEEKHYIGNCKKYVNNPKRAAKKELDQRARDQSLEEEDDDLPF